MATPSDASVSFDEIDTRSAEMHRTIEEWIDDLVIGVDDAQTSAEFQEWFDVQSRFHDYSYRNTLLIKRQCPDATKVAGYRTWQEEFDRHVESVEIAEYTMYPVALFELLLHRKRLTARRRGKTHHRDWRRHCKRSPS